MEHTGAFIVVGPDGRRERFDEDHEVLNTTVSGQVRQKLGMRSVKTARGEHVNVLDEPGASEVDGVIFRIERTQPDIGN
jgi:hypothetical protein